MILDYRLTLLNELVVALSTRALSRRKLSSPSFELKKKKKEARSVPLPKHFKLFPELVQFTEWGVVWDTMDILNIQRNGNVNDSEKSDLSQESETSQ